MKGQLSAEMLIIIAVVLAVVALVGFQLIKSAEKAGDKVDDRGKTILDNTESYLKAKRGDSCREPKQCASGSCFNGVCE